MIAQTVAGLEDDVLQILPTNESMSKCIRRQRAKLLVTHITSLDGLGSGLWLVMFSVRVMFSVLEPLT